MSLVSGLDYRAKVIEELIRSLRKFETRVAEYVSRSNAIELSAKLQKQINSTTVTLQMIELRGAVLLSQEIEKLLHSISLSMVRDKRDAATVLIQASEKLLEYLRYIHNGSADIPLALLPLLNDMRAVQNARLLSEAIILFPDFTPYNRIKTGSLPREVEICFKDEVKYVRAPLMRSLLTWYKEENTDGSLNEIYTLFDGLYRVSAGTDISRLWRAALAIIESLTDGGLQSNASIKSIFAQLERFLKRLMELKRRAIYHNTPLELFKNLLYYIALSSSTSKKVQQIKSSYQLQELLPNKPSRDQALHALDGPGIDMLQAVGNATRDELTLIKNTIEIFAHADDPDIEEFALLPDRMRTLTSTLEMLGMYRAAENNKVVIHQLEKLTLDGEVEQSQLLLIAANTLRIDLAVDEFIHSREHLGPYSDHANEKGEITASCKLSNQQYDELLVSLLTESLHALERIKDLYLEEMGAANKQNRFMSISEILEESASVLQILPMPELALLFSGLAGYTKKLSALKEIKIPQSSHTYFADVVSCLEVYIDLQIRKQPTMVDLLGHSADALELLLATDCNPETETEVELASEILAQNQEDTEPELVDIFMEEAMQQFSQISVNMSKLRTDSDNLEPLELVRRSYHTLKGSGRMVGAHDVSEFSWANENLLNRVLIGSLPFSKQIISHLEESLAALPQLIDQIHGVTEQVDGVQVLVQRAFDLAEIDELPGQQGAQLTPTLADIEDTEVENVDVTDMTQTLDVTGIVESADTLQLPPMDQVDTIEISAPIIEHVQTDIEETLDIEEEGKKSTIENKTSPTDLGMDSVLLEIFTKECAFHISNLNKLLDDALQGEGTIEASETMVRAFHTLMGSAQTAHATSIAAFLSPIESAIKRKQRARSRFSRGETFFLSETVEALEQKLQALFSGESEPASVADVQLRLSGFIDRINTETEGVAEAPGFGELQSVFIEEAQDIVEQLQRLASKWRKNTGDLESVRAMHSGLHTLKGSARVASYTGIADLAHAIEDALQRWSHSPATINVDALDALSDAFDALGINVEQARSGEDPGYFDWLIDELSDTAVEFNLATEEEPDTDVFQMGFTSSVPDNVDLVAPAQTTELVSSSYDRIRLDASTINRLTNLNNESGVFLSHTAQYQSDLSESLNELDQTVKRLRSQLRELDIESELFVSTDRGEANAANFDSLELDRYSHLQTLSRAILESFSDLDDIRYSFGVSLRSAEVELGELRRTSNATQEILTQIRMVRFKSIESRLQKTFNQATESLGKKATLNIQGTEFAVDQSILKPITVVLEHLLRNSVAHGIESNTQRIVAGKTETGVIDISFSVIESDVFISLKDDGAGIDIDAVREKAVAEGMLSSNSKLSNQLLLKFLSQSGFSTDVHVDQISGRGVGLDAVQRELKKIAGIMTLQTDVGKGTCFVVKVPQPRFLNQVLLITLAGVSMALPSNIIHGVTRINASEMQRYDADSELKFNFQGQPYKIIKLYELLQLLDDDSTGSVSIVFLSYNREFLAVVVDSISSHLEVIVKPVGKQLALTQWYSGAAVQSDGTVIPILDLATVFDSFGDEYETNFEHNRPIQVKSIAPDQQLKILVVDDSITMRKYAQRTLLQENYLPELARDGVEAMQILKNSRPALIITDLEMPRMDGFELIQAIRDDINTKDIPVIVITSRTGNKHLKHLEAMRIDGFLGKPYQEKQLLNLLNKIFPPSKH